MAGLAGNIAISAKLELGIGLSLAIVTTELSTVYLNFNKGVATTINKENPDCGLKCVHLIFWFLKNEVEFL